MNFEGVFKQIDDILWKDAGCSTALDYVEQSSWILFLKYLDDMEQTRELKAELTGEAYHRFIDGKYRWSAWAMPRDAEGNYDHTHALVGQDLLDFVNTELWPYLSKFND